MFVADDDYRSKLCTVVVNNEQRLKLSFRNNSLGLVENSRKHLCFPGSQPDPNELRKLQAVEKHLNKCTDLRRVRDWSGVLRETDNAIASGADACSQVKIEAFFFLSFLIFRSIIKNFTIVISYIT